MLGWMYRGAFWRTRDNKFEGETSRKPIFFIFWPNEVPKKPNKGFLDVLNPLAWFSTFEDFFCRFFTIEVSEESSRELEALID